MFPLAHKVTDLFSSDEGDNEFSSGDDTEEELELILTPRNPNQLVKKTTTTASDNGSCQQHKPIWVSHQSFQSLSFRDDSFNSNTIQQDSSSEFSSASEDGDRVVVAVGTDDDEAVDKRKVVFSPTTQYLSGTTTSHSSADFAPLMKNTSKHNNLSSISASTSTTSEFRMERKNSIVRKRTTLSLLSRRRDLWYHVNTDIVDHNDNDSNNSNSHNHGSRAHTEPENILDQNSTWDVLTD